MANQYQEQFDSWQSLESKDCLVSAEIWDVLDVLIVAKLREAHGILNKKDYKITRGEGVIVIGLIQTTASFIKSLKTSENNEITKDGDITLNKNFLSLLFHCVGNDLIKISGLAELSIYFSEELGEKKLVIEQAFKDIFETIDRLKTLTRA